MWPEEEKNPKYSVFFLGEEIHRPRQAGTAVKVHLGVFVICQNTERERPVSIVGMTLNMFVYRVN